MSLLPIPTGGETLFIKDVWPEVKLICYFEYYYSAAGQDFDFDPEFSESTLAGLARLRMKNTTMQHALEVADAGWSPTKWQQKTYPQWARSKIDVIHEGVDTDYFKPNAKASFNIANKNITLTRQDEVITFSARALEPVRGFHVFMRALPDLSFYTVMVSARGHVQRYSHRGIKHSSHQRIYQRWKNRRLV